MSADKDKRKTLSFLVGGLAGGGLVAASVPFVRSLTPAAHTERPYLDVDITKLKDGQMFGVEWHRKPIYVLRRSPALLDSLKLPNTKLLDPNSKNSIQPESAQNIYRSARPDVLVVTGICTHKGCSVSYNPPNTNADYGEDFAKGLFFCPCHGSKYDLSGRVHKNMPAPRNLDIPNYEYIDDHTIRLSEKTASN